MFLILKNKIDNLCDYTYNFTWQNNKIRPDNVIPSQADTKFTYSDLVNEYRSAP
jgi:formylmethanofuran dehydrogenase subunit C